MTIDSIFKATQFVSQNPELNGKLGIRVFDIQGRLFVAAVHPFSFAQTHLDLKPGDL